MNKSTKFLLASVSPVALAAGWAMLDSSPAHATVSVTATTVTYASENFVGASAASTIVMGASALIVKNGATTTDFSAGFATFTLSNSATFAAAPTPTVTNTTLGTGSLVSGSTAVTYSVTAQTTTSASITLGNFSITNVGTRLATSNQAITITYASLGSNVPATASATVAIGAQAYSFVAASSSVSIDLANSGAGLVFRSGSSNVTFASLGSLSQGAALASNDIGGSVQFTASSSDSLRAIVKKTGREKRKKNVKKQDKKRREKKEQKEENKKKQNRAKKKQGNTQISNLKQTNKGSYKSKTTKQ